MKKIFYGLLVFLTFITNANASKYEIFIGAEAALSWVDLKGSNGNYENEEISTYGIKVGVIDENSRVYLSYNYLDAFEDSSNREGGFQTLTINTEAYTQMFNITENYPVSFFFGAHIGGVNLNVDSTFGTSHKSALLYGLQAGVMTTSKSPINLEFGYRYSSSRFIDKNNDLEQLTVAYVGINYKF
ncbi:hypothetical protein [Sulfurimonas sp.]|uniref:hypothetical protein n=1 Tax=Sulfurimonas sp. TaxID=2022749 RepID=UPI0039E6B5A5